MLSLKMKYLHSDKPVINHHFFGEKISSYSSLVLITEFLVHILVHQGCFSNSETDIHRERGYLHNVNNDGHDPSQCGVLGNFNPIRLAACGNTCGEKQSEYKTDKFSNNIHPLQYLRVFKNSRLCLEAHLFSKFAYIMIQVLTTQINHAL